MAIESGDRILLEYVGRFEDGSVFATSKYDVAREHGLDEAQNKKKDDFTPLSFTVGRGEIIEGLDEAVLGMTADEKTRVSVPPAKGYGEYDPERVREYDAERFEEMVGEPPEIEDHVEAANGLHGDVTAITEESVQVDFNHELAGKTLVFEIEILDVL